MDAHVDGSRRLELHQLKDAVVELQEADEVIILCAAALRQPKRLAISPMETQDVRGVHQLNRISEHQVDRRGDTMLVELDMQGIAGLKDVEHLVEAFDGEAHAKAPFVRQSHSR